MSSKLLELSIDALSSKVSKDIKMQDIEMESSSIDSFTPLEAAFISCILEKCLDQLAIIGCVIPANVDSRWDDTFKTIDETYGVPDEPKMIFREDMGFLPIIPTEAEKLQRDRTYAYKVLKKLLHEIKNYGRFDTLQEEINNIARKEESERKLEENVQTLLNQVERLREQLQIDKKANEEDKEKTIELAQESDVLVEHTMFLNDGKLGYVEKWVRARLEQQELEMDIQRKDMLNKLNKHSKEYNEEQIISAEISAYLEADIKEKKEQIDMWTKKYNKDIKERQQQVDELKIKIEEEKLKIEKLEALINERQTFIDKCTVEEELLKQKEKLNKAATIIQSIWRGYMVRQQLGKYKGLRKRLKRRKKLKEKIKKEKIKKEKKKSAATK